MERRRRAAGAFRLHVSIYVHLFIFYICFAHFVTVPDLFSAAGQIVRLTTYASAATTVNIIHILCLSFVTRLAGADGRILIITIIEWNNKPAAVFSE